jgi:hypothetical protein
MTELLAEMLVVVGVMLPWATLAVVCWVEHCCSPYPSGEGEWGRAIPGHRRSAHGSSNLLSPHEAGPTFVK